mmetsp:Transcript_20448/g.42874  ORF Transcript_20448/g.42874 Transcript_20448/m.42874 type:complete len:245 (-) Transcript_20448:101-835(-)
MILEPFHRVGELDSRRLVNIGNIHTTIPFSRNSNAHNLSIVRPNLKMQMGEQISVAALHLTKNGILILKVANVAPHGKVLNEHLKKVIIVNGLFEFGQFFLAEGSFAKEAPFNIVLEAELVGRSFAAIPCDTLTEAHLVLFGTDAVSRDTALGGRHELVVLASYGHVLLQCCLVFTLIGMLVAEGEGVVTVCLGRVVERTDLIHHDVDRIVLLVFQTGLLTLVFLFEESSLDNGGEGRQYEEGG